MKPRLQYKRKTGRKITKSSFQRSTQRQEIIFFYKKKSFNIKNPKRNRKDKIKTKTNIKINLQDPYHFE